jgi:hypothetical protein
LRLEFPGKTSAGSRVAFLDVKDVRRVLVAAVAPQPGSPVGIAALKSYLDVGIDDNSAPKTLSPLYDDRSHISLYKSGRRRTSDLLIL